MLFSAAELDPSQFQPAEPVRTWLATSDTRMAWTGTWPGSKWPLRIEAATLRGKPVAFALIGPWNKPDRMPPAESIDKGTMFALVLGVIFLAVLIVSVLLARRNLAAGRGDRRGAVRIAVFIFSVQMLLWLTRSYLAVSLGTLGMFLIAICTASFYGLVLWTVYLALEPYVRRYWPHTDDLVDPGVERADSRPHRPDVTRCSGSPPASPACCSTTPSISGTSGTGWRSRCFQPTCCSARGEPLLHGC